MPLVKLSWALIRIVHLWLILFTIFLVHTGAKAVPRGRRWWERKSWFWRIPRPRQAEKQEGKSKGKVDVGAKKNFQYFSSQESDKDPSLEIFRKFDTVFLFQSHLSCCSEHLNHVRFDTDSNGSLSPHEWTAVSESWILGNISSSFFYLMHNAHTS